MQLKNGIYQTLIDEDANWFAMTNRDMSSGL